jgi:hypothetical protein
MRRRRQPRADALEIETLYEGKYGYALVERDGQLSVICAIGLTEEERAREPPDDPRDAADA